MKKDVAQTSPHTALGMANRVQVPRQNGPDEADVVLEVGLAKALSALEVLGLLGWMIG